MGTLEILLAERLDERQGVLARLSQSVEDVRRGRRDNRAPSTEQFCHPKRPVRKAETSCWPPSIV
ncbi:MAG: hypothetical protein ACLP8S_21215 [Solirubrobacteraceae bacterium]